MSAVDSRVGETRAWTRLLETVSRMWHQMRGHRVKVRWANPGWRYACACGKGWTR